MTILLEPAIEARLRERAARAGQDADMLANTLLGNALLPAAEQKETSFKQAMVASGLISRIKPPRTAENAERPVFEVQGEPLSETIIRERR